MRVTIANEGDDQITATRFIMEPGAMKFDEDKDYPVSWNFDQSRPAIGKARLVHREDNGEITAEIVFFDEAHADDLKPPLVSYAAWSKDVDATPPLDEDQFVENLTRIVHSTTLMGVGCTLNAGFPPMQEG